MLRLLVWYASLVDIHRSLPLVARVAHASWFKPEPAQKVISALAWLLRMHGGAQFEPEIGVICRNWSAHSAEVKRLEENYLSAQAVAREQREQEASDPMSLERQPSPGRPRERLNVHFIFLDSFCDRLVPGAYAREALAEGEEQLRIALEAHPPREQG